MKIEVFDIVYGTAVLRRTHEVVTLADRFGIFSECTTGVCVLDKGEWVIIQAPCGA